ncbi:MAG: divergent PAP2 family protein [bacterium]|nr:divergent PAP2 family protein [bacterium]
MTPIVYTAVAAWALSQLLKVVIAFLRIGRGESGRVVWRLVWAGGMPSSHSAFTTSTLVMIALTEGIGSSLFGLAFVFTAIVIYDRTKLHHIYLIFQSHFPALATEAARDPRLKDLVGHTTAEVAVGVAIGLAAAGITWALTAGVG